MMILTVDDCAEFEGRVDFSRDIVFAAATRRVGRVVPAVDCIGKIYGIGKDKPGEERDIIVWKTTTHLTIDDVSQPDPVRGLRTITRAWRRAFEEQAARLAAAHGCRAISGNLEPSPISGALAIMLEREFNAIDERLCRIEAKVLPPLFRKEIKNRTGVQDE